MYKCVLLIHLSIHKIPTINVCIFDGMFRRSFNHTHFTHCVLTWDLTICEMWLRLLLFPMDLFVLSLSFIIKCAFCLASLTSQTQFILLHCLSFMLWKMPEGKKGRPCRQILGKRTAADCFIEARLLWVQRSHTDQSWRWSCFTVFLNHCSCFARLGERPQSVGNVLEGNFRAKALCSLLIKIGN